MFAYKYLSGWLKITFDIGVVIAYNVTGDSVSLMSHRSGVYAAQMYR